MMMQNRKMSKIITIFVLVLIVIVSILTFVIPPLITTHYDEDLIIYNWADYMDLSVLDDFAIYYEEVTGKSLDITYSDFDTNETMLTEIIRGDSKIDLICPSEYAIQKLLNYDKLEKVDWNYVTDLDQEVYAGNIKPEITEKIQGIFSEIQGKENVYNLNDYFVPYMWGTLGVLYNTNYVSKEELEKENWGIFWNTGNNPDLDGRILVKDSIRDTYACSVLYLKEQNMLPPKYEEMSVEALINCTDDELIALSEQALKAQRPHLKGYEVDFGKDDMVNEDAYVDLAWSGDAMYAIEEAMDDDGNSYLDYYIPSSGSNVWFDGWVMPKENKSYTPNYRAAHMFLNYLCKPDVAMLNNLEIGYTTAVDEDIYTNVVTMNEYDAIWNQEDYESMYTYLDDNFADDDNYDVLLSDVELVECYEIDNDIDSIKAFILEEYYGDQRRYTEYNEDLGMMQDFGNNNEKVVKMWERVKSSGEDNNWTILGITIGVLVGLVLIVITICILKFYAPHRKKVE